MWQKSPYNTGCTDIVGGNERLQHTRPEQNTKILVPYVRREAEKGALALVKDRNSLRTNGGVVIVTLVMTRKGAMSVLVEKVLKRSCPGKDHFAGPEVMRRPVVESHGLKSSHAGHGT